MGRINPGVKDRHRYSLTTLTFQAWSAPMALMPHYPGEEDAQSIGFIWGSYIGVFGDWAEGPRQSLPTTTGWAVMTQGESFKVTMAVKRAASSAVGISTW